MSSYETLSQEELLVELNRMMARREQAVASDVNKLDEQTAREELVLHRLELEMQNRELQQAQAASEEAKNRYRRLYDFAPVGYCSLDHDGRIVELNLTASRIFRSERMFCVGARLEDLCPPLNLDAFRNHLAACQSRHAQVTSDIWVAIETRGWVPLEFRTEMEIVGGRVTGFNTIITERHREEGASRLIESVRRTLVNSSPHRVNLQAIAELIASSFADVCIIESLDVVGELSILGVHGSPDAIATVRQGRQTRVAKRGAPMVARTGEPDMQTFRNSMLEPASELGPDYCPFLRALQPSSYLSVPLRAKTTLIGVMTLVMRETVRGYDDRDLRVAQELASSIAWVLENARQLAETQRQIQLRQDLLALVAHDLRAPLNALHVSAELFLDGDKTLASSRQAEIIRRSVDAMAHMIEDLLDFSSIEAGRLSLHREPCDIAYLLSRAIDVLKPSVVRHEKPLKLTIEQPIPAMAVLCDKHRILQVLTNLGENAIKFTDSGEIGFSARVEGNDIVVSVQDSGRGIARETLPHVFERYWRPRRERQSGRGLGLFIVRGIIESHDGRIWVESEPGKGTCFTFTLPMATSRPAETPPEHDAANLATMSQHETHILVVEDDAQSRGLMRDLLARHSYRVHTASNGHEALALARVVRPSVILLDLSMPTMDGQQFVRAARGDELLARVPIILVSGDVDLRSTARELRVAGYTQKPIQVDKLLTTIATALS